MTSARLRPTRNDVVDAAITVALVGVALVGFRSAYGGVEFLIVGLVGCCLGIVLAHLLRHPAQPPLVVAAATVVVYLVFGTTVALRTKAAAGVLPSLDAVAGLLEVPVRGWSQLLTTAPPAGAVGNLLALPYLCGLVAAVLMFSWARRTRSSVWPVVPAVVVLALSILLGTPEPVSLVAQGAVFAGLTLGWWALRHHRRRGIVIRGTRRRRRWIGGAAMLLAASAVGYAVGPSLPFADARPRLTLRDRAEPPFDAQAYPSPLNGFQRYLREQKTDVLFTVDGWRPGMRIRLATLDTYDGRVWGVAGGGAVRASASGAFLRVGTTIASATDGPTATLRFTNQGLGGVWLPDLGEPTSVRFGGDRADELADAFRYNPATGTAVVRNGLQPGDSWTVRAVLPPEQSDRLAGRPAEALALPEPINVPEEVKAYGAELVGETSDPYQRAKLLEEGLRAGFYSDGTTADTAGDQSALPGHGAGRLQAFVTGDQLVGNAEQYAAAMGLMATELGLPARVVMGFAPRTDQEGTVDVTGDDVSAWVEVAFDGVGWVAFDPTPDRSRTPSDEVPRPRPAPRRQTQVPPPPPIAEPDAQTPKADETAEDKKEQDEENREKQEEERRAERWRTAAVVGGIAATPLVLAVLALGAVVLLKWRRRRRRRLRGPAGRRVAGGWREVEDLARDMGRPVPDRITRLESAAFVGHAGSLAVARRADEAVFGPDEPDERITGEFWSMVDDLTRAMRRDLPWRQRLRARVATTSLRRRDR